MRSMIASLVAVAALLTLSLLTLSLLPDLGSAQAPGPWKADADAEGYENTIKPSAESVAAGQKVYAKYCMLCHGEAGDGKGPSSQTLTVPPAAFTDKAAMSAQSDGAMAWKILTGRGPMPSWAPVLQEEEVWNVINYVRTFSK